MVIVGTAAPFERAESQCRDLFVLESPGKLRTLRASLASLGIAAEVTATLGHLYGNPPSLRPVAIARGDDGVLQETQRGIARPNVMANLRRAIEAADRVFVATDDDQEGDVIAQDIAGVVQQVRPGTDVQRLRAASLGVAGVREALGRAAPLLASDAVPGTARRMADRLIGAAYTDFGAGVVVGRVQSAVLGLCQAGAARRRVATASVPAADGGRPFELTVELPAAITTEAFAAVAATLPPAVATSVVNGPRVAPMNGGDALLVLESDLGLTIDAAADLLQAMYEAGKISYPRTGCRGVSGHGAEAIARLASVRGILAFKREALARQSAGDGPHEAVRVLAPDVDLLKPLALRASLHDAAEAVVARRMIEAGVSGTREVAEARGLPLWARSASLTRDSFPRLPWGRSAATADVSVRERSPEAALVAAMMAAGIGRPSTWAHHARRLVDRQLVDEQLHLTPTGAASLQAAPAALRLPAGSLAFERAIEGAGEAGERALAALRTVHADRALQLVAPAMPADVDDGEVDAPDLDDVPDNDPRYIEEETDAYVYRMA